MKTAALVIAVNLLLVADAAAQAAPPAAPGQGLRPMTPPASSPTRVTVEKSGTRTTVTQRGRCTTVKVCPGNAAPAPVAKPRAHRPPIAPALPPPPPAAPRAAQAPPPPPAAGRPPVCAPTYGPAPLRTPKRPHLNDPARTRLGIMGTAEVLGHGQWEIASRGIVGLLELSVGLGDRFQLSFKTSPITWFIPGAKDALWMGEVKAQIWRSPKFKLTGELAYFHIAGMHGLRPGLSMKIGGDKFAFHAGLGSLIFINRSDSYDTCAGPVAADSGDSTEYYGCAPSSTRKHEVHAIPHATLGIDVRFWRYGKFFIEAFVAGGEDTPAIGGVVPGVRFHGKGFAADLGLGFLTVSDELTIPLPVLNFSYRW